jgi:hypothetical protein
MTDIETLPRSGEWEVGLVAMPELEVEGETLEGVLLVVDDSGLVRVARPTLAGLDLTEPLVEASCAPTEPLTPARPKTLRCREALRERLEPAATLLGARLELSDRLPTLDEASASLRAAMTGTLPRDPRPWAPLLEDFVRAAPWSVLPDSVHFRFPRGMPLLERGIAVVLGQAGEQIGLAFYPTDEDYDAFGEMATMGLFAEPPEFTCWCVHLDPLEEFSEDTQELLQSGLLAPSGLGLRLFVLEGMRSRALTPDEEVACRAVLEAVLATWKSQGVELATEPTSGAVTTSAGSLLVFTEPGPSLLDCESLILEVEHRAGLLFGEVEGAERPILLLKMAKRDALRLSGLLEDMDAISVHPSSGGGVEVLAWAGPDQLGVLTRFDAPPFAWLPWEHTGEGATVVAAGGAKRPSFRAKDIVSVHPVEFLRDETQ